MVDDDAAPVELPVVWDESDVPVYVANMFSIVGSAPNEIFLSIGQVVPPGVPGGSATERREYVEKLGYLSVRPIGRFSLTEDRLREFHGLLSRLLEQIDASSDQENAS